MTDHPTWPPQQQPPAGHPAACAYHPGRPAGVRCQRCGNPICGECMVEAPVGHQCRRCLAQGMAMTRQAEGPYGGRRSANPALTSLVLIGINALVWVAIMVSGGFAGTISNLFALTPGGLCEIGVDTYIGVSPSACVAEGGSFVPGPLNGGWWQVLTSAFTHISILHIGMNMLALWFLGPAIERVLGRARFLALYFVSALTASAFILWLATPTTTTLGASGAISGLMGALLVLVLRHRGDVRTVLMWIGINVVITVVGSAGISWQGHLGGFLGGIAVTALLVVLRKQRPWQWMAVAGVATVALVAMAARVIVG